MLCYRIIPGDCHLCFGVWSKQTLLMVKDRDAFTAPGQNIDNNGFFGGTCVCPGIRGSYCMKAHLLGQVSSFWNGGLHLLPIQSIWSAMDAYKAT